MECARTPTKAGFVASGYGPRPGRRTGETRFHAGLDFRAPSGTPVFSPVAGVVESRIHDDGRVETTVPRGVTSRGFRGYGNVLVVKYPGPVWVSFNHLRSFGAVTAPGNRVGRGHWLGLVGNTSNGRFRGMGAHLHIEARHAPRDGRLSPFPGAYGRENFDPVEWFSRNGVELQSRILRQEPACGGLAGLGAVLKQDEVAWKSIADRGPKAPSGVEYEPSRAMDPPKSVIALTVGLGFGILGLAALVARGPRGALGAGSEGDGRRRPGRRRDDDDFTYLFRNVSEEKRENLFSQIRREKVSITKALDLRSESGCDIAYNHLELAYEKALRLAGKTSGKEEKRLNRIVSGLDEMAELIDFYCEKGPSQ